MFYVRGGNNSAYFNNNNYGRVVEGNLNNSYGPWVDPELQRASHHFGRRMAFQRRQRPMMNNMGQVMF